MVLSRSPAAPAAASRPLTARVALTALCAGLLALGLYRATLLPGFDFGDTGSFHATVGSPTITPRDGYPLYFAIGDLTLWATGGEPAHALNLASAIEGGAAIALFTLAATELTGSLMAGLAGALLFAGSYTFWTQAIIAEVYALHALFVSLTLLLILRWEDRPGLGRLTAFFALYALGFGNHLSMILLAPGYTLFLFLTAPRGWRTVLSPRVIAVAAACAAAGALQYAWNLRALWFGPWPPHGLVDALRIFWFDVTKSDWRATMVMHTPSSMVGDRLAMYWFDLRQQFGWPAVALAAAGLAWLATTRWRRAALMATLYAVNVVFAFTYNVGDTHVFYLPSHLMIAMLAACGVAAIGRATAARAAVPIAAAVLLAYAGGRMYRDYPAVDRSSDARPQAVLDALTRGLDDRSDIFLADLNWQVENGMSYYTKETRPEVADARMPDVLPYLPALVCDNAAIGRRVTASERARDEAAAQYGPLFDIERDPRVATPAFADTVARLRPGTRYALIVLKPTREFAIDPADYARAIATLTGGAARGAAPAAPYFAAAGLVGSAPVLWRSAAEPFAASTELAGTPLEVRMESWLASDTIRRMGFAHAIAARHHTLIAERGISFAAFDDAGVPLLTAYAAGIFAPEPRYLIGLRGSGACYR